MNQINKIKSLNANTTMCEEILKGHDKLDFTGNEKWSIDVCMFSIYNKILNLKNDEIKKKETASKIVNLIDDYIEKYNVKLLNENKEKLDNLRSFTI